MNYYPIVFETEDNGAISAYVPGLPIYAAADSQAVAERAIRNMLQEYLATVGRPAKSVEIKMARWVNQAVTVSGMGAALGHRTSKRKAAASRVNGLKGGRPRKDAPSAHLVPHHQRRKRA